MNTKIYKLLSGAKLGLFALVLTVFSGTIDAQTTYTFYYTGGVQTMVLPAGSYSVSCWGADGGTNASNVTALPGKGGYSKGTITLAAPTTYSIYVGGKGNAVTQPLGGFNSGNGTTKTNLTGATGGGGASDIRVLADNFFNRIIVAGGGGGQGTATGTGGHGGGLVGQNGQGTTNVGIGGTQTAPGLYPPGGDAKPAVFGEGGDGPAGTTGGQGGGGWYGGSFGTRTNGGGAGGSGYVLTSTSFTPTGYFSAQASYHHTNAITLRADESGFVPNPVVTGHGLVLITELCNLSISALGATSGSIICAGNSATLTNTGISNWSWSTGATTSSIVVSPAVTTVYTLSAMGAGNCTTTRQFTLDVTAGSPTLAVVNTASATGGVCPNGTVALTASGALSYVWVGGSGGVTNGVAFAPTAAAIYTVTGTNACGSATAAASVSIHTAPTLTVTASTSSVCSGGTATLTATGANTLNWSNGVQNGVSFVPAVTTTYVVTGTSANGCTASAASPITVVPTPILAPVLTPTLLCAGNTATFTASGATNYSWSTNQTTSSITVNPVITTTYSVTKWNSTCTDTKTFTLFVNQPPTVLTNANPTTICAQATATLDAYGGTSYSWTPYGGNLSQAIVSAAANTIFTVTVSDGTCVGTAQVPITVNPLPVVNIAVSAPTLCANESVTVSASGTDTYSWTNPTGLGTATTIVDTPAGNTSYQVTGTNTLTGCSSTTNAIVLVSARPTLTVAASKTLVCIGGPSTLSVKGASISVQWLHNAATTTATIVNPLTTTVYSVTATNTTSGCPSTSLVTVNVFQPTFAVNSPTSSCAGGTIVLMASGANSYTWQTTPPLPFANINVSPGGPTVYTVVATSTLSGVSCTSSSQVNVSIYSNPTVTAVPSRTQICTKSETVELQASGATTFTWNTQQTGGTVTTGPLTGQTVYTVTGTDQNGCLGTTTVMVKTSGCVGIGENAGMARLLIYPNPSTGDFVVEAPGDVQLIMTNELGQVVRTFNLNGANQHKARVSDLATGVYFITGKQDGLEIREKIIVTR